MAATRDVAPFSRFEINVILIDLPDMRTEKEETQHTVAELDTRLL